MVGTIVIYTTELAFSMAYECASFLHAKRIYFLDYVQCTLTTDDDNFSLQASDGSTYLHGQPTNKAYAVELTTFQPRLFIVGSVVGLWHQLDKIFSSRSSSCLVLCVLLATNS